MIQHLINSLAPPVFDDERKTLTARLLNTLLLIPLAGAVVYPLLVLVFARDQFSQVLFNIPA